MAGASTIIAQGVDRQIVSYPGFRLPARVRLVAAGAGAALPTVDATRTTPGVELTRSGVGILQVKFPGAKDFTDMNPQVRGATPETANTRKTAKVDNAAGDTFANGGPTGNGQIQLYVSQDDSAANADLAVGDTLDFCFTVEYG